MKTSDFRVYSIQMSAFTTGLSLNLGQLSSRLIKEFGDVYGADPVILPLPDGAPKDIPRLILKNSDESEKLQVCPAKIDIIRQRNQTKDNLDFKTVFDFGLKILVEYENTTKAGFGRIALVVIRTARISSPASSMAVHFCRNSMTETKALSRPEVLELHAYKRYGINDEFPAVNSWIRHKAGRHRLSNGETFDGVIVEQDINTPQEPEIVESTHYSAEKIRTFFDDVSDQMAVIMKLYYPEEQNA